MKNEKVLLNDEAISRLKSLAEEITASYLLAIYPKTENRQNGKFRQIRIESQNGFQIKQNRSGYEIKR